MPGTTGIWRVIRWYSLAQFHWQITKEKFPPQVRENQVTIFQIRLQTQRTVVTQVDIPHFPLVMATPQPLHNPMITLTHRPNYPTLMFTPICVSIPSFLPSTSAFIHTNDCQLLLTQLHRHTRNTDGLQEASESAASLITWWAIRATLHHDILFTISWPRKHEKGEKEI